MPRLRTVLATLVLCTLSTQTTAQDKKYRYALVPKATVYEFYHEAKRGCESAAKQNGVSECIFKGSHKADFRQQDALVNRLLDEGIDGLAIAVINSEYLMENSLSRAKQMGVSVVTFDADLTGDNPQQVLSYRRAYVGTDNYQMGFELGKALAHSKPSGNYAIISGNRSANNLNQRLAGARDGLKGTQWREVPRSPAYSDDNKQRAQSMLLHFLEQFSDSGETGAVIGLGAWPQENTETYRRDVAAFKNLFTAKKLFIINGDTEPHQLDLVKDGLSHVNVGQAPFFMGKIAIELLEKIRKQQSYEEINYTPLSICRKDNVDVCVKR